MKVASPADYSHVAPLGRPVAAGEVVEVDDELGAQLLEQGWTAEFNKGGAIPAKAKSATVGPGEFVKAPEAPSEKEI